MTFHFGLVFVSLNGEYFVITYCCIVTDINLADVIYQMESLGRKHFDSKGNSRGDCNVLGYERIKLSWEQYVRHTQESTCS